MHPLRLEADRGAPGTGRGGTLTLQLESHPWHRAGRPGYILAAWGGARRSGGAASPQGLTAVRR